MSDHPERRKTSLTDHDIDRIGETFESKIRSLFENIGYDVTTPESRKEIYKDHTFIRTFRNASIWLIGVVIVAVVGAAAAAWSS